MSIGYFDASALVKLVLDEPGADLAVEMWNRVSTAAVSRLAVVEVEAAIAAARRRQGLGADFTIDACREWRTIRPGARIMPLTPAVADTAAELVHTHALSGADAVHLASALAFGVDSVVMVTWDRRLAQAALAGGLPVVPAVG